MTMADCRHGCGRITSLHDEWVHLKPGPFDHAAEPPLTDRWHQRDQTRDRYGHRWPKPNADPQLPANFYDASPWRMPHVSQ